MPRYFFHTRIGDARLEDPSGRDLRDPDQAWETARGIARAMLAEPDRQARLIGVCLVVTDASGEVVLEFPFAEAIVVPRPAGGAPH